MTAAPAIDEEVYYQALVAKDSRYEGSFIACVKTTGIFCRPTCHARKPKRENVEFVKTAKEAIQKGYRPCKVCQPLERLGETPAYITAILDELNADPSLKLKDADLLQRGADPIQLRRWFLKHHGITFQAYQRMFRINAAFKRIQNGEPVTATAYEAGFASLSGFSDSFRSVFGVSPRKSKAQQVIDLCRLETPLGTMIACGTTAGICLLEFTDRKMLETEFIALSKQLNATILQGDNPHFPLLKQELEEYFEGHRQQFTVPLFTPGSAFQQQVWAQLRTIPYGTTRSYREQALAIQKPEAVRAVANANGMNRISILIPCHRVIGSNGSLTGYGGGLWRKQWLLELERKVAGYK
jgi:AraC family transcriptional regulator of adaptative response/methylated-DNA-[protein]-cysteine methyltransferase